MKLDFPLFLRWHPDMNREFMRKGLWTNIEMGSEPAFHNDEQTIRGLVEDGASLQDVRDYTLQGCTHPYPFGTVYGTPIFVNGAKVMELVMYNGYDPRITDGKIGILFTCPPEVDCTSYDELVALGAELVPSVKEQKLWP